MTRLLRVATLVAAFVAMTVPAVATAQWPERPIRVILPFSTGGGPDLVMRMLAEPLAKRLGQPIVVENRPGANGIIALEAVAKATPDGHTLGVADNGSLAINPHLYRTLPYDPRRSFTPITILYSTPFFLAVSASTPARSWNEFTELARSQPGRLNFGSSGIGSPTHLDWEMLERAAGIDLVHVPHKGLAPLMTSLLAGDVATALLGYPPLSGAAKAGKIRILAIAAEARSSAAPEIPTLAEVGGPPDFRSVAWVALVAPRGIAVEVQSRLVAEVTALLREPEIRARIESQSFLPGGTGPDALMRRVEIDTVRYGEAIRQAGIQKEQ